MKASPLTGILMLWVVSLLTSSCTDTSGPVGSGDLLLSVAANEAVRVGFPHEENGETLAFVDDWDVKFDMFAVSLGSVELVEIDPNDDGAVLSRLEQPVLVDIASSQSGEVEFTSLVDIPEGRHDFEFRIAPPTAETSSDNPEVVALMRENAWSVLVRGTATPGEGHPMFDTPITFEFGFPLDALYFECINGADGTRGVVIADNRQNEAYIYPHIVHIFWDKLGAGNEKLRFDAMAMVAGEDNLVTMEDLDKVELTDPALSDEQGVPLYDDAGLLDTYTLGAYARRALAESFHLNGIGFCKKRLF